MTTFTADLPNMQPSSPTAYNRHWADWDARSWALVDPWSCAYRDGLGGFHLTIQPGFITDGGSVPRWAWSAVNPLGRSLPCFILHDGLYGAELLPRQRCDEIMFRAQRSIGVGYLTASACYRAVRIGGASVWAKHTRQTVLDCQRLTIFTNI